MQHQPDLTIKSMYHGGRTSWLVQVDVGVFITDDDIDDFCENLRNAMHVAKMLNTKPK